MPCLYGRLRNDWAIYLWLFRFGGAQIAEGPQTEGFHDSVLGADQSASSRFFLAVVGWRRRSGRSAIQNAASAITVALRSRMAACTLSNVYKG